MGPSPPVVPICRSWRTARRASAVLTANTSVAVAPVPPGRPHVSLGSTRQSSCRRNHRNPGPPEGDRIPGRRCRSRMQRPARGCWQGRRLRSETRGYRQSRQQTHVQFQTTDTTSLHHSIHGRIQRRIFPCLQLTARQNHGHCTNYRGACQGSSASKDHPEHPRATEATFAAGYSHGSGDSRSRTSRQPACRNGSLPSTRRP